MAVSESEEKNNQAVSETSSDVTKNSEPEIHPPASVVNGTTSSDECKTESNSSANNLVDQSVISTNNNNVNNLRQSEIDEIFKVENLQQLSTNALPPYSPGSPPRFNNRDIKAFDTHCCTDCGDTFALKASLNFHLERRSVLIKFPCETCKTTSIFYNRCNLLSHIRSHIDKSEKADIGKASISVVPRVFMDGIQNDFVNALDDDLDSMYDNDGLPPGELLECSLQEYEGSVADKPNEVENNITFAKVKCLDCNEEFDSVQDRKEHLTNGDKMPLLVSHCNKCGLLCPSKCSLKAHQRIHLQISPYVCPECGDSPDPLWANFLHHVNYKCFHNSRGVGYKCPICKGVSSNNDSLLKHMELHTEKYAKCFECPRAYNSAEAFKQHNSLYHEGNRVRYTMIFKCSLCDIVFVSEDQMLTHRATHLKEQVCEYVFNCMQCGKPLESKAQLMEHVKLNHPKIYKQNIQTEPVPTKPTAPSPNNYKGMVECILCNSTFYSHQGYSVHISRAHININQTCGYCNCIIPNRKAMIKHGKTHLENKAIICLLCNNKRMLYLKDLESHLDNHIRKLKFCSFCPVCDQLFPNLPEALNHLRLEHFLPATAQIVSPNNEDVPVSPVLDTVCHFCRESFVNNSELQVHLRQKHSIVNGQNSEKSPISASCEQPLKKQRIDGNSCAKCDFHSANREDFKKHILSHKTNRNTFQCQECGLCFVVQPSLSKHLRIVHKINDTIKYISDEGTNYTPDLENAAEVASRSALECSVCFTSFPNETVLKTHMRSHGMAFIQANKTGLL